MLIGHLFCQKPWVLSSSPGNSQHQRFGYKSVQILFETCENPLQLTNNSSINNDKLFEVRRCFFWLFDLESSPFRWAIVVPVA